MPFIEHKAEDEHDCKKAKCQAHKCKPLAASTVRQIHSVISGTLSLSERWGWINSNLARVARRPKAKAPEPDPPSPAEAARLVDEAFRKDEDWGTLTIALLKGNETFEAAAQAKNANQLAIRVGSKRQQRRLANAMHQTGEAHP
jgi:integrase